MTTITLAQTQAAGGKLYLRGTEHGDFRDQLARDGFAVVKGAVPKERAEQYANEMYQFLEDFNLGFDRNDPSTVLEKHMPIVNEKGMIHGYGVAHETFAWGCRGEPGVVDAFAKIFNTDDLICSFDAVNMGFPGREHELPPNNPWPHQDQDPAKHGFRCLQGLVNLLPCGPNDGGLIVCKGAHHASEEFHREFEKEERIWAWTKEWYGFTEAGQKWLADKGYQWEKVCMEPGDLVIWDSRTPHYNLTSTTKQPRFAVYVCMMPAEDASQEDLIRKKAAFEECKSTTHWPNAVHVGGIPVKRNGELDPHNYIVPRSGKPQLSERVYKLTGIPYIKADA